MSIEGVNVPNLGKTVFVTNNIGVSGIGITGQSPVSGIVVLIPSGRVQMAYSGNNIVVGSPTSVDSLGITGGSQLTGPISLIPTGIVNLTYSGNNLVVGTPVQVSALGITGQNPLNGSVSLIPSGAIQMAYSGNNIIIGRATGFAIGSIFMTGNITATPFSAANIFTRVSGFSQTGAFLNQFTMPSSGQFKYIGVDNFVGIIDVHAAINPTVKNKNYNLAILKNGTYEAPPGPTSQPPDATNNYSINMNRVVTLVTNDIISLAIQNQTDTTSVIVESFNCTIR